MTTKATRDPARVARRLSGALRRVMLAMVLLAGAGLACGARAESVLKDISYQAMPGGRIDLTLKFSGGVPAPKIFTTDNPPRIAVDLANTQVGLAKRRVEIGTGSTSSVTAVSAGGRTRVVVDLFHASSYSTHVEGDSLVMSIANGMTGAAAASAAYTDPSKMLASATASVGNIDFRRGSNGSGEVVVSFEGNGASADMHREGDRVIVDFSNVKLPEKLAQRLDVNDFATPVSSVVTRPRPNGARMEIATHGVIEPSAYQTGNQYVVEIAAKKAEQQQGVLGKVEEPKFSGSRVTFNFQDIPTRSVLQLLADVSNLNIVASDSVGGSVTLRLVNVPWDQALAVVLRAKNLDMRKTGNVIWVAPQTEIAQYEQNLANARMQAEQAQPLVTDYIPISYGKAADIAKLLTQKSLQSNSAGAGGATGNRGFLSARGSVSYDDRTNTLLVSDIPEKIREIRALVAVLDKPVQQVLIESRIVIATDSFARDLGAKFGMTGFRTQPSGQILSTGATIGDTTSLTNSIAAQQTVINQNNLNAAYAAQQGTVPAQPTLPPAITFPGGLNVNLPATPAAGSFGLAILGSNYLLDLELSAMQTEGRGEVISSPRVITASQQEAVIKQGQEIGYVTFQNTGGGAGAGTATVQFKDAVLQLKVTPTITADNRVYLQINVKKDALAGFVNNPGGGQVPQIDTREINTSVLVDNGQTVVLGGIYEVSKQENLTKVPGLGDIPGLGVLFRNKQRTNTKAELLIFVTPKILGENMK